jgi:hypothetical protein
MEKAQIEKLESIHQRSKGNGDNIINMLQEIQSEFGYTMCLIIPGYLLATRTAPRNSSSLAERVGVTIPILYPGVPAKTPDIQKSESSVANITGLIVFDMFPP